jgi:hypothetical protein
MRSRSPDAAAPRIREHCGQTDGRQAGAAMPNIVSSSMEKRRWLTRLDDVLHRADACEREVAIELTENRPNIRRDRAGSAPVSDGDRQSVRYSWFA